MKKSKVKRPISRTLKARQVNPERDSPRERVLRQQNGVDDASETLDKHAKQPKARTD